MAVWGFALKRDYIEVYVEQIFKDIVAILPTFNYPI